MLRKLVQEPLLLSLDVDSKDRILLHKRILEAKPLMKEVCREIYDICADLDNRFISLAGSRIELGAGVSFIKELCSDVVVSDVIAAPHLDQIIDSQDMKGVPDQSVPDQSVAAFYGIHCFHHFSEPCRFFSELTRTLKPDGGCILIEPYFGLLARIIYPRLFNSETFDMEQLKWETPSASKMSNANQALSYVVFFRDKAIFEDKFSQLEIVHTEQLTNYLRYTLSGGLNFRSLVPRSSEKILRFIENILYPLRKFLALHHVIVLKKKI